MAANKYVLVLVPLQGTASQTWDSPCSSVSRAVFDTSTYKVAHPDEVHTHLGLIW